MNNKNNYSIDINKNLLNINIKSAYYIMDKKNHNKTLTWTKSNITINHK